MRFSGVALLLCALPLAAQDSLVERGFDHFYNLEYDQALADFRQAIAQTPNSPDLHNHLAQTLVFREMFRDGALESELVSGNNSFLRRPKLNPSPETEREFLGEVATAMSLSEARLKKDPDDPGALYALGISYGLRANYYWVVKKSWRESLRDATAARREHNRLAELEPENVDARLVQGLHDYIVGSLPVAYRLLGFLAGIRGDKEKGIHTIEEVARHGNRNRLDAEIFLGALYRRENRPLAAVPLIRDLIAHFPRNYLLRLELSQMYSMGGDKARAFAALQDLERLKRNNAPGYTRMPWETLYFQEGTIQFWYRDFGPALENLKKVAAADTAVDLNTGALTYLRIGQIYDLMHRRQDALAAYHKCIEYAPRAEAAQESRKYLTEPYQRL
ncbi:MAG TPA: tetratricopeptide repeat protein [Bryobacteraceae bacterium]|nr:tetratricopeptide repeat protein [Bryobacteraceae bacterium]